MSKTNVDGDLSRGEKALNEKENFKPTMECFKKESAAPSAYESANSEFDSFINEATETNEDRKQAESDKNADASDMSAEDAMELVIGGINELEETLQSKSGKQVSFGDKTKMLLSAMFAPVIMKYSKHIAIDPEKVDMNSRAPEYMALGGAAVLGGLAWYQWKNAPELEKEPKGNGNKSESS